MTTALIAASDHADAVPCGEYVLVDAGACGDMLDSKARDMLCYAVSSQWSGMRRVESGRASVP